MITDKLIKDLNVKLKTLGLRDFDFKILSESAHVIVHLQPYDLVARIAINPDSKTEIVKIMAREIDLANFLDDHGVPVINSKMKVASGPYKLENHCFSLWPFYPYSKDQSMTPKQALRCLKDLSIGLKDYPKALPELGVWKRVRRSADNLKSNKQVIQRRLLEDFQILDTWMGQI